MKMMIHSDEVFITLPMLDMYCVRIACLHIHVHVKSRNLH